MTAAMKLMLQWCLDRSLHIILGKRCWFSHSCKYQAPMCLLVQRSSHILRVNSAAPIKFSSTTHPPFSSSKLQIQSSRLWRRSPPCKVCKSLFFRSWHQRMSSWNGSSTVSNWLRLTKARPSSSRSKRKGISFARTMKLSWLKTYNFTCCYWWFSQSSLTRKWHTMEDS